jgi:polysaccharide export outer membrane protein
MLLQQSLCPRRYRRVPSRRRPGRWLTHRSSHRLIIRSIPATGFASSLFGQEGLTNAYLVDAAGLIDVPLIGHVLARGATTEELTGRIAARLRNGFIREPHVAVEVVAYRPFFILGEVTAPGQYPYVPRMTAETAVAIAGGFTPRAFRRNLIIDRPIAGRIVRMSVPPSFPIHPGDTVNVQERWF